MSTRNTHADNVRKSGGAKTEPNKAGPLPGTYFGNSRDIDTDRFNKDGQRGGGSTRKGK